MVHSINSPDFDVLLHWAKTVNVLEQEKEAAELSRFEDSRQRGELHEK